MNNNPLFNQFGQFMNQMRGQNSNNIINQLLSSGRITQKQVNMAYQKAKETEKQFDVIKKNFGF